MHPVIVLWHGIAVQSYSVCLVLGILVAHRVAVTEAGRVGLDNRVVTLWGSVMLISGIAGARALYVLGNPQAFRDHWMDALAIWHGGHSLFGAVSGALVSGVLVGRWLNLPLLRAADSVMPSVALMACFGRIGCFLAGCCFGRPTNLPWGVVYPRGTPAASTYGIAPTHPSQIYLALTALVVFTGLWLARKRAVAGTQLCSFVRCG